MTLLDELKAEAEQRRADGNTRIPALLERAIAALSEQGQIERSLSGKVQTLDSRYAELEAQLGEARNLLSECKESLLGVPMSKRVRGDSRLAAAVDAHLTIASIEPTTPAEPAPTVEQRAKEIYESWFSLNGYVPWVEHGNSLIQDEARKLAKLEQRQAVDSPSERIK